jgi:type IV pilus assembly protein PilM
MDLPEFFGLDIGSSAIRVAQVRYDSFGKPEILAMAQVPLENPIQNLKDPNIKDYLVQKIIQAKNAAGIKTNKVVAALPEAMIFSKSTSVPNLAEDQIEQMLYYELKNHIPVNPSEVQKDYIPLGLDKNNPKLLRILLIAAPKNLVEIYIDILKGAGLEPMALETETVAISRIVGSTLEDSQAYLVADFGHKGVDICLLRNDKILFTQSIGTGSESLTKALAADFNLSPQQADQYKIKVGLLKDQAEGKVLRSLNPIMHVIINEINKLVNYFKTTIPEDTPKQIFLVGEGAKLPGLEAYVSENLFIPCYKIDPVQKISMPSKYRNEFAQLTTIGFTVAVGLAMKIE